MILLDTVTIVWFTLADERLGTRSRDLIDSEKSLRISAITPWEVAMLVGKKRLSLAGSPMDWVKGVLADPRMELAPIEPRIAVEAGLLPRAIHGDPADRLLIATARALACPVLTPDRKLLAYAEEGYLQALDARL